MNKEIREFCEEFLIADLKNAMSVEECIRIINKHNYVGRAIYGNDGWVDFDSKDYFDIINSKFGY